MINVSLSPLPLIYRLFLLFPLIFCRDGVENAVINSRNPGVPRRTDRLVLITITDILQSPQMFPRTRVRHHERLEDQF